MSKIPELGLGRVEFGTRERKPSIRTTYIQDTGSILAIVRGVIVPHAIRDKLQVHGKWHEVVGREDHIFGADVSAGVTTYYTLRRLT